MRIVGSNEEEPHAYVAGQRVGLWCQLSRPAAPVHWYKDGEEVEAGESLVLEQEGPRCRLVLPCARPQDTGEFVCDAGGDSVFYNVTVAGGCDAGALMGSPLRGFSSMVRDAIAQVAVSVSCCAEAGDAHQVWSCWVLIRRLVTRLGSLWQLWCLKPPRLTGKGDSSFCWSETLWHLRAPSTSIPGRLPDHGQ